MNPLKDNVSDIIDSITKDYTYRLKDAISGSISQIDTDPIHLLSRHSAATAIRLDFDYHTTDYPRTIKDRFTVAEFKFGNGVSFKIDINRYGYYIIRNHINILTRLYDDRISKLTKEELEDIKNTDNLFIRFNDENDGSISIRTYHNLNARNPDLKQVIDIDEFNYVMNYLFEKADGSRELFFLDYRLKLPFDQIQL